MNSAIICDTQFQIINCLNLVYHNYSNKFDIYVGEEFPDACRVIRNIEKTQLFQNVYSYKYNNNSVSRLKHTYKRINELITPNKCVQKMLNTEVDFFKKNYKSIYISAPGHFMTLMIWINSKSDVIYFDDGTGSYSGNILDRMIDNKHRFVYRLFGREYYRLRPKTLYVNNIQFCRSSLTSDIRQLPKLNNDKKFIEVCKNIFELKDNIIYKSTRCVYLGQSYFYNIKKSTRIEMEIQKTVIKNIKCIARPHPGEEYGNIIPGFIMDNQREAWELICIENIQNNTILIGRCSTAQITPKIIFNKEPFLIFTYKLLGKLLSPKDKKRFDELTKSIEREYKEKNKIMKPTSFEELKECIQYCKNA